MDDPTGSATTTAREAVCKAMCKAMCKATVRSTGRPCGYASRDGGMCRMHARAAEVECPVCMLSIPKRSARGMSCGHVFHARCIGRWFARGQLTCPMCRSICLEQLRGKLSMRLAKIVKTIPPVATDFFPTYIIGVLGLPSVAKALDLPDDDHQMLVELAYQSWTREMFFANLRMLKL